MKFASNILPKNQFLLIVVLLFTVLLFVLVLVSTGRRRRSIYQYCRAEVNRRQLRRKILFAFMSGLTATALRNRELKLPGKGNIVPLCTPVAQLQQQGRTPEHTNCRFKRPGDRVT